MKDTGYRRKTPQFESSPNQKNDKVGARNMKEVTHFECKECDYRATSKMQLQKHKHLKHPKYEMDQGLEKQYNCIDCDFQASTETQLEKHVNLKHKVFINSESKERFYCHACDLHFGGKGGINQAFRIETCKGKSD